MKKLLCLFVVILLIGCGSGGGDTTNEIATPTVTELEGTWIYSSDGHPTGGACGLDSHGHYGERVTLTFDLNQYTYKYEGCLILSGNTGGYFETENVNGTFVIGDIFVHSDNPEDQMRALDLILDVTHYTSYNITDDKLHIAGPYQDYDGTTPERRAFQTAIFWDDTGKMIINPTFIRQLL